MKPLPPWAFWHDIIMPDTEFDVIRKSFLMITIIFELIHGDDSGSAGKNRSKKNRSSMFKIEQECMNPTHLGQ
jgi:hypothetical protein